VKQLLYTGPHDIYNYRWPPVPKLLRYKADVHLQCSVFGDLAAMSGDRENRQWRDVTFVTDSLGFRNKPGAWQKELDLIVLGDSFGVGAETTQDKIWSTLLEKSYGHSTYNLSVGCCSPWAELMNLRVELDRLKRHENTVVLWALFSGNDLDEYYGPNADFPVFASKLKQTSTRITTFRRRSAIRQFMKRIFEMLEPDKRDPVVTADLPEGGKMLFYKPYVNVRTRGVEASRAHDNYPALETVFDGMKELSRSKSFKVIVISIPSKCEVYDWLLDGKAPWQDSPKPSGFSKVVEALCQEAGFEFLDIKEELVREGKRLLEDRGEYLWWRDDTHWSDKGHAAAARIVHDKLLAPLSQT
jgi:hypothetical protein